jgi:succinate dehydrogenase flavin-adding protein (antitoxin of CptAB toxin-antitoxin module)
MNPKKHFLTKEDHEMLRLIVNERMSPKDAYLKVRPHVRRPDVSAVQWMKRPIIIDHLRNYRLRAIRMDASEIAYNTWRAIAIDEDAKNSDRNKAAEHLHKNFGFGSVTDEKGNIKELEEMDDTDLDNWIEETQQKLDNKLAIKDADYEMAEEGEEHTEDEPEETDKPETLDSLFPKPKNDNDAIDI